MQVYLGRFQGKLSEGGDMSWMRPEGWEILNRDPRIAKEIVKVKAKAKGSIKYM